MEHAEGLVIKKECN